MDEQEKLRLINDQWQQDDERWRQEIEDWQHETQRLVALLYMLEKALPEQSSKLDIHKARIDKHNEDLNRYRCGLEKQCPPACPSHIDIEKNKRLHKMMALNHEDMQREHKTFSREYHKKMRRFRELAERLMNELQAFS
ncbi:hypothetical protein [Methylophaga sp. OBS1]|uniref:hypothetical protein n=1 Tax=Methylophaga sp. OBS1 TaxID=2991933 RepID=UPI002250F072|nr:hypothetical protein [Methylophaga sp. OBS1]MCX4193271.1 hypothetical protein [Methylophaga sp. OBS1]